MHGFWVASLQVWPRWALTVIRFVEKYFTFVKDPKNSGQSLVAALQSRPPLTLTINTIRDYVSMYMQLFTPLYVTSHHYDICTGTFVTITWYRLSRLKVYPSRISLTFRSARKLPLRSPVGCKYRHALRAKHFGSRVFLYFPMAPSVEGERARKLANTLFGAKDGGRHHQERASALTSLRRQIRCCALATIITWVYELIDRQLAAETVTQAQRRLVRRKLVNTTARS